MPEPVVLNLRLIARDLSLPFEKVQPVVNLLDEGHPVPFIARYRKDQTGNLEEEEIRAIQSELQTQRSLAERKQTILRTIESLGKLTPELEQKIRDVKSTKRLEDLYLPYKPKRQTLASLAKSRGLEPLALEILDASPNIADFDQRVSEFINEDKEVKTAADALLGAGHIISEIFSEKIELRSQIREIVQRTGVLATQKISTKKEEAESTSATEKTKKPRRRRERKPKEQTAEQTADGSQQTAEQTVETVIVEPVVETLAESEFPDHSGAGGGEPEEDGSQQTADGREEVASENHSPEAPENVESVAEAGDLPSAVCHLPSAEPDSDVVSQEFQQWKDRQKEQEKPVVKSQNQVKKKKQTEKKKEKEGGRPKRQDNFERLFQDYFNFSQEVKKLQPHRVLAINRGERARVLRVRLDTDFAAVDSATKEICVPKEHPQADYLAGCARDAVERLIMPTLEREVHNDLTDNAEKHAVRVFARNLRNLLLQPPLRRKKVLAMDPGFKQGCKIVALDEFGNVLDHAIIHLTSGSEKRSAAEAKTVELIQKFQIHVIAIGNGTGCRETEEFVSKIIADHFTAKEGAEEQPPFTDIAYVITNEAGASVYSASPLAKEEFPDYDILLRGAISIGRRLQDPLNELVKVEPVSLGVGMYQHDLKAKHLRDALNDVVESCVNYVGVDLNTATPAILRYVSGLNQLTAKRVYEYRVENGPFKTREDLKKVPGLGEVAFTHCAGFLRISDGSNPLDATWIHPEMYDAATKILEFLGFTVEDLRVPEKVKEIAAKSKTVDCAAQSEKLGIGPHTIYDILGQLAKPGRDPREELPPPIFKKGILKMEDIQPDMELSGTILNVVDFGAFVDIGLHESGLIHISHLADRYVKDAHDHVSAGDVVRVWVVSADRERGRISLTMIPPGTQKSFETRQDRGGGGHRPRRDREGGGEQKPHENRSKDSRDKPKEGGRREFSGDKRDRDKGRDGGRGRGGGGRYDGKPKSYVSAPQEKVLAPISENMKKGKEPLRSFGDLAQLFGRVQVVDPAEEKRKKKEEQKARRAEVKQEQSTETPEQEESV
ncbi:MAG: helix-hairpin-helix domain-containing protein [Planctomycetaceae bacterium]|nr:helix-hairpin-helix domain-containing protein [Planctomycetaceae bacterium]